MLRIFKPKKADTAAPVPTKFSLHCLPAELLKDIIHFIMRDWKTALSGKYNDLGNQYNSYFIDVDDLPSLFVNRDFYRMTKQFLEPHEWLKSDWFRNKVAYQASVVCGLYNKVLYQVVALTIVRSGVEKLTYSVNITYTDTQIEVVVGRAAPKTSPTFMNRVVNASLKIMHDAATWFNGPIDPDDWNMYFPPTKIELISSEPCYVDVSAVFYVSLAERTATKLLEFWEQIDILQVDL